MLRDIRELDFAKKTETKNLAKSDPDLDEVRCVSPDLQVYRQKHVKTLQSSAGYVLSG